MCFDTEEYLGYKEKTLKVEFTVGKYTFSHRVLPLNPLFVQKMHVMPQLTNGNHKAQILLGVGLELI